ncbi:MAG: hypothetical protein L3K06_04220 [Thermoplasmata archaeon]|nr:hypothetical protein [Thermoplasmata archaeon]
MGRRTVTASTRSHRRPDLEPVLEPALLAPPELEGLDPEVAELVAAASEPLPELAEVAPEPIPAPLEPAAALTDLIAQAAQAEPENVSESVTAALQALAVAHQQTVEGISSVLAAAARTDGATRSDTFALTALAILDKYASREQVVAPAPDVHVHLAPTDLRVQVEGPTIEAPQITVDVPENRPQPAPIVYVDIPETAAPAAPVVNVHVPEAAAPVVNVPAPQVTIAAAAPPPPPRPVAIRVEVDPETGEKLYIPEELVA